MTQRDRLWDIARLGMDVLVIAVAILAIYLGRNFRPLAAYFPLATAGMILVIMSIQFVVDIVHFARKRPVVMAEIDVESPIHGTELAGLLQALRYIGWFVGYIVLLWVTGVLVSGPLFVAMFLKLEARWSWRGVGFVALGVLVVTYVLIAGLELSAPRTLLGIGDELL